MAGNRRFAKPSGYAERYRRSTRRAGPGPSGGNFLRLRASLLLNLNGELYAELRARLYDKALPSRGARTVAAMILTWSADEKPSSCADTKPFHPLYPEFTQCRTR